jgi:hypothetical protein
MLPQRSTSRRRATAHAPSRCEHYCTTIGEVAHTVDGVDQIRPSNAGIGDATAVVAAAAVCVVVGHDARSHTAAGELASDAPVVTAYFTRQF